MKGKRYIERFRVVPGEHVHLSELDPGEKGKDDKRDALVRIGKLCEQISELQQKLFAERKRSVLLCLQGLDAAGKDGVVKHVIGSMNPDGCHVANFKEPSTEELAHDFLWRVEAQMPRKGEIVIFNRSHYEDVLIVRVHHLVPREVWSKRYEQINDFERRHAQSGTRILKFFLHISKEEQLRRFEQRLDDPTKRWKISESDYTEREYWDDYVRAYDDALTRCNTGESPWFVIPSDHKWFRDLAISEILVATMEAMDIKAPKPTVDIEEIRRKYHTAFQEEHRGRRSGKNKTH